ncbi:DUF2490 domain-containing protein [Hyphobacterium sp. CCMP332]|nr:DUF2490 domain-containing protein [Hyphobacterium sp. CCMP332]
MKISGLTVAILLIFIGAQHSEAQKKVMHQDLLWARHYLKIQIDKRYIFRHEIEERVFFKNLRQHQFMTRAFIDRSIGKGWNSALGFAYFLQASPEDPGIEKYITQTELRPIFEFGNRQILSSKIIIDHRYWTEFRFFEKDDRSYSFRNLRFRYRLEMRYQLSDLFIIRVLDELHFNAGGKSTISIFDQNRIGFAIQFYPMTNFGFELAYINWYQQQSIPENFYNRNIIRFTVFLHLNAKSRTDD